MEFKKIELKKFDLKKKLKFLLAYVTPTVPMSFLKKIQSVWSSRLHSCSSQLGTHNPDLDIHCEHF